MALLSCRNIHVAYGRAIALNNVSFDVEPGTVHAIVGANGAGKSTLLQALVGAVPCSGEVILDGHTITGASTAERARRGLTIVPQGRQIFPRLSVVENLRIMSSILGTCDDAVSDALDTFPVLARRARTPAGVLSGGEQQMLAVARALMRRPLVLLLDEAATGLAPQIVDEVLQVASDLAANGSAVVMAEPMVSRVADVVTQGTVLLRGEVIGRGDGTDLEHLLQAAIGMSAPAAAHEPPTISQPAPS